MFMHWNWTNILFVEKIYKYVVWIRVWRIYLNILCTNIFGHSFVANLFVQIYSDIHSWVCWSVKTCWIFEDIPIFNTTIYLDIRSCRSTPIPDICHFLYTGKTFRFNILHPKIPKNTNKYPLQISGMSTPFYVNF